MDTNKINSILKKRKPKLEGRYNKFAVLIPLIKRKGEIHVLFEVRAHNLNTQPGEICFPGGKIEKNESPMECSIRETSEELNINKTNIQVIGKTDYIVTPFNIIIYPYVGIINNTSFEEISFNHYEVDSIFTVPLDFFLNNKPEKYYVYSKFKIPSNFPYHKIQRGKHYKWRTGKYPIFFYEYNNYIIWGITARIINNFIYILKNNSKD